ncbi:uncharacterized protein LOC114430242 [Parambassis ranga]|nr:uncharacterized protein LOC114430242 [Parambassis ranga]
MDVRERAQLYREAAQVSVSAEVDWLTSRRNQEVLRELSPNDMLCEDPNLLLEYNKLMGYLMGYLCVLTGHRSVVMTNMTKENVLNAERTKHGFHITVDEHKTVRTYGQASLFVTTTEHSWLRKLIEILSVQKIHDDCSYVFASIRGNQIVKPVHFLQAAWRDAGLGGIITFNKIRSSASTQASKYLTVEEKEKLAKAMCHDTKTAERFYVALPDKKEASKVRDLRLRAMNMAMADVEERSPTEDETTEDEDEPVLESEGYSSPTFLSEDSETARKRGREFLPNMSVDVQPEPCSDEDELPCGQSRATKRKLHFKFEGVGTGMSDPVEQFDAKKSSHSKSMQHRSFCI